MKTIATFSSLIALLASTSCASVQPPTLVTAVDSQNTSYSFCAKEQFNNVFGTTVTSMECATDSAFLAKQQTQFTASHPAASATPAIEPVQK